MTRRSTSLSEDQKSLVTEEHTFTIGKSEFLLDGEPFVIRCGEIHFTRVPPELWTHRLQMCKAMGLNSFDLLGDIIPLDVRASRFVFVPRDRAVSG